MDGWSPAPVPRRDDTLCRPELEVGDLCCDDRVWCVAAAADGEAGAGFGGLVSPEGRRPGDTCIGGRWLRLRDDPELAYVDEERCDGLFTWRYCGEHPSPTDPCPFRTGGEPVLVGVTTRLCDDGVLESRYSPLPLLARLACTTRLGLPLPAVDPVRYCCAGCSGLPLRSDVAATVRPVGDTRELPLPVLERRDAESGCGLAGLNFPGLWGLVGLRDAGRLGAG